MLACVTCAVTARESSLRLRAVRKHQTGWRGVCGVHSMIAVLSGGCAFRAACAGLQVYGERKVGHRELEVGVTAIGIAACMESGGARVIFEARLEGDRASELPLHRESRTERAEGRKCARSWRILPEVGADPRYPELSLRDADAVAWWDANRANSAA